MGPRAALVIALAGSVSSGAALDVAVKASNCFEEGTKWDRKSTGPNMDGQVRSREESPEKCQARCASVSGCAHFSFWKANGGCHLQDKDAHKRNDPKAISGPPECPSKPEVKATCDSYSTCPKDTVNKGKGVQCSADTGCDTKTCCEAKVPEAKATCDSYKSCPEDVPVNKGSGVECVSDAASCNVDSCCEARATCDSWNSCPSNMPVNKGSAVECKGAAADCDIDTCCEAKATCDTFASCPAKEPVNKGSAVECSSDIDSCDSSTCCEAKATCDSFTACPDTLPINKGSAVECVGSAATCDSMMCCEAAAPPPSTDPDNNKPDDNNGEKKKPGPKVHVADQWFGLLVTVGVVTFVAVVIWCTQVGRAHRPPEMARPLQRESELERRGEANA